MKLIKTIQGSIRASDLLQVNTISGIEQIMNNRKKLRKTHMTMLIVGILMDLVEIGTVLLWIFKGIWWPFAAGMPVVILMGILITRMYHRNAAFVCANCNTQFQPAMRVLLSLKHMSKTRMLQCPKCGHTGYCVEVGAQD